MSSKSKPDALTGNRGEWSEIYAFLKVLADGEVCGCDEDLEADGTSRLKVLQVIRNLLTGDYSKNDPQVVRISCATTREMTRSEVAKKAEAFFERLCAPKDGTGAFEDPDIDDFLRSVGCRQIKAPSKEKRDMELVVSDPYVGGVRRYGFSVKSQIGSPATLLNASKATNARFLVEGLSDEAAEAINAIDSSDKRIARAKAILDAGASVSFVRWNDPTFGQNLAALDDGLPEIVAQLLLAAWFHECSSMLQACQWVEEQNPRHYATPNGCPSSLYALKIRRLLRAVALGMTPKTPWTDKDDATGGYLIVRKDGNLVAFYIYNRAAFDRYLFRTTRFEIPSLTRNDAMRLYKEDGKWYINLCLNVRFTE